MGLENIGQPIRAENIQDREDILNKKLIELQVAFAAKKYSEWGDNKPDFTDTLEKNSRILHSLRLDFSQAYDLPFNDPQTREYINDLKEKINASVKNNQDYEIISGLISDELNRLEKMLSKRNKSENVGIIKFNPIKGDILGEYGFGAEDDFFEIHMEDAYKHPGKFGLQEIKIEFSKIAELIVDKYSEARAVIGTSWLMSHPIMEKLGFHITDIKKDIGMAHWVQFINKDGQIDTKKVEELLKTGKAPYEALLGYMPTEEFLQRYLPENRRGLVNLRVVNEDNKEIKLFEEESIKLRENIGDKVLKGNLSAEEFLKEFPVAEKVLEKLGVKEEYISIMDGIKSSGDNSLFENRLKILREKVKEYINQNKYKDKVVEIK